MLKNQFNSSEIMTPVNLRKTDRTLNTHDIYFCDFETLPINNVHHVIAYCITDKENHYQNNYFFKYNTKEDDEKTIINNCENLVHEFLDHCDKLSYLSKKSGKQALFYFHNFGRFDSFFILSTLCSKNVKKEYEIDCINRDNRIYSLKLKNKSQNYEVYFKDSYLILPISLEKIGETFCQEYKKLKTDFILDIKDLFNGTKMNQIQEYCQRDCDTLQEGILNYEKYCYSNLKIDPLNYLSLPSISLALFRGRYYDKNKTPIGKLSRKKDIYVRNAFLGGIVDVYKPYLLNGFHYDVNSLYPYIMKTSKMPLGVGTFVNKKEINLNNFFGFVEATVECSSDMYLPFLSIKDNRGRILNPTGCFSGTFFSEELVYAQKLGYKITEVNGGYLFDQGILFDNFVDDLYEKRIKLEKKDPLNTIIKLILNSLYGRFGLNPTISRTAILNDKEHTYEYLRTYEVTEFEQIKDKYLINYIDGFCRDKQWDLLELEEISTEEYIKRENRALAKHREVNHAVQLAAAITAYARIYMHQMKSLQSLNIYYSDTDSIFSQNPLPDSLVSDNKLGCFKLEGKIKEAIFIAPKTYYVEYTNNKEAIKCKGVKTDGLTKKNILDLYNQENKFLTVKVNQFKKIIKKFEIMSVNKTLSITGDLSKREKVYIDNKWVDTKPFQILKKEK